MREQVVRSNLGGNRGAVELQVPSDGRVECEGADLHLLEDGQRGEYLGQRRSIEPVLGAARDVPRPAGDAVAAFQKDVARLLDAHDAGERIRVRSRLQVPVDGLNVHRPDPTRSATAKCDAQYTSAAPKHPTPG